MATAMEARGRERAGSSISGNGNWTIYLSEFTIELGGRYWRYSDPPLLPA